MKNKLFYVLMVLTILSIASCKENTKEDSEIVAEDSTKAKTNALDTVAIQEDTIKKRLSKYSLNKLIITYNANKDLKSSYAKLITLAAADIIIDLHEIDPTEYDTYSKAFWGTETPIKKSFNKEELHSLIGNASDDDYIEFTFDKLKDNKFKHRVVSQHTFKTGESCFPALTFKNMYKDPFFSKLEITKGTKVYTKPPSKYNGPHDITLFIYEATNGLQYFDIVSDPTIDRRPQP